MTKMKTELPEFKIPQEIANLLDQFKPTKRQELDWHWMMMRSEVRAISDFIKSAGSAFEREFEDFDARVAEEAAKLPEALRAELVEEQSETAFNLTEHFPAFLWQTTFVTIYSFLEVEMIDLASRLGRHLGITRDPEKGKQAVIINVQRFLTNCCGLEFPRSDAPWTEIVRYTDLRNVFVHGRGRLRKAKNPAAVREYVESKAGLSIVGVDQVRVDKEFCEEVLKNAETLLEALFGLARDRVK